MSGSLFFVFYCMFPLCPYNRKELSNFVASWEAKLFAVSPKCNNNKKKFFIEVLYIVFVFYFNNKLISEFCWTLTYVTFQTLLLKIIKQRVCIHSLEKLGQEILIRIFRFVLRACGNGSSGAEDRRRRIRLMVRRRPWCRNNCRWRFITELASIVDWRTSWLSSWNLWWSDKWTWRRAD